MPSNLTPPQAPPLWTHTPQAVMDNVKAAIDRTTKQYDAIASMLPAQCNFESVFVALADVQAKLEGEVESLIFYQNVSPSKELRDAANDAEALLRNFYVESEMRLDLFHAATNAKKNIEASKVQLNPEQTRLVEKIILDGVRAGLALPEEERAKLTEKKKKLSQKCLEFSKNFNEEKGFVTFTKEELDGVPADVISGYKKHENEDKYDVTFKTPDIFPIYKFANNPETRRRAMIASEARLTVNVPILDEALALRRELAGILKYPTWADYITEDKMVGSAKGVIEFLDDLETRLLSMGEKDRAALLRLKKEDHEKRGLPFDNVFYLWDYRYYDRLFIEKTLSLDDSLVKEYFPVDVVVPAILEIYQKLLGVKFFEFEGPTWHPDVQQFTVWEANATDASGFVGYCYLDLYPREAKYSHAAVWPLIAGYDLPSGKRNYPIASMVANLAKPTPERPALMTHDDVVTFFHEMGHVFHGLLSKTQYARFHGTRVARDFVEAPSQMLENWCWEPQVLQKMSSHYKTKEPLSKGLIDKIIQSRYVNVGLYYLRQVFYARFDIKVHTEAVSDTTKLWNELRETISLVKGPEKYQPGQGSFGHLTGGYDAGYYGYTYSLVFAADMYDTVFRRDPLDPAAGKRYRDEILLPGGSREESLSLEKFLGRKPTMDAFLKELFGSTGTANL